MKRLNNEGQILIFATLGFVLLGVFVGLAVDMGRGYLMRSRLQRAVDASSLAAAKALKGQVGNQGLATQAAQDAARMNGYTCCSSASDLDINFVTKSVQGGPPLDFAQITGRSTLPTTFSRLLNLVSAGNFNAMNVSAFAEAGPERPVDLIIVLDRSGSMDATDATGTKKIDALKIAVNRFLDSGFTVDDRIGMVSFAWRGCGNASGNDSTVNGNCTLDKALGTSIAAIKTAVNGLCEGSSCGGTNTQEALRTAGDAINVAFSDPTRVATRKAIVLVTDGQPTYMKRFNDSECKKNPFTGATLPADGNGNLGGGPFPNGCVHGVSNLTPFKYLRRRPLTLGGVVIDAPSAQNSAQIYKDTIRSTRDTLRGALFEANKIRDYGLAGSHDVIIFAISIGDDLGPGTSDPQSSMDENAKCLLARIANDPGSISICNSVYTTTADGDTHLDLKENWPCATGPCINSTQQQGKVYTVTVSGGSVVSGLDSAFKEIAALLKLRLTI
jgi:Flp pilus assembly protein TadG